VTLKGQYIKKIEWGIILYSVYLPRKNNLQILFFRNLEKKLLSAYMDNTLNGEKSDEIKHISVNFRTT
jgi:hypothetical protein